MDAKQVRVHCSILRDLVGAGPSENPEILSKALDVVRSLGAAAEWDYPQQILEEVKIRLVAWFSDRQWQGDDADLRCSLLRHVHQLPRSWDQSVGDPRTRARN